MDGITDDVKYMKDTLIAIERETQNITSIIVRLLLEQNTPPDVQAMNTNLLAIERETYILTTIINRLLQETTLIGRLQRISSDVEGVVTQIELYGTPAQQRESQSQPTMQQLYYHRQSTLKRRRLEHKRQLHQSESHAAKNDDQAKH